MLPLETSGKASPNEFREPGDLPRVNLNAVGETADWRRDMTTHVQSASRSGVSAAVLVGFIGLAIMFVTGHVQANTLHDAAHDMRHATGFPCH